MCLQVLVNSFLDISMLQGLGSQLWLPLVTFPCLDVDEHSLTRNLLQSMLTST